MLADPTPAAVTATAAELVTASLRDLRASTSMGPPTSSSWARRRWIGSMRVDGSMVRNSTNGMASASFETSAISREADAMMD